MRCFITCLLKIPSLTNAPLFLFRHAKSSSIFPKSFVILCLPFFLIPPSPTMVTLPLMAFFDDDTTLSFLPSYFSSTPESIAISSSPAQSLSQSSPVPTSFSLTVMIAPPPPMSISPHLTLPTSAPISPLHSPPLCPTQSMISCLDSSLSLRERINSFLVLSSPHPLIFHLIQPSLITHIFLLSEPKKALSSPMWLITSRTRIFRFKLNTPPPSPFPN